MQPRRIAVADGGLLLWPDLFASEQAALFAACAALPWQQHRLRLFGQERLAPRLSAWLGDPGCVYRYSGLSLQPLPFTPALDGLRVRIEALTAQHFNSVLANLYRDGADGMGWHADDEPELGAAPWIASLSLGATRRLRLRRRDRTGASLAIDLPGGSLLLMAPPLQRHWLHSVPKTRRPVGPRINLTWRCVRPVRGP